MEPSDVTLFLAFGAGIISFLSPCVLPIVPGFVTHLAGSAASPAGAAPPRYRSFLHALAFVTGFAAVFVALGASLGLVGFLVYEQLPLLRQVGGLVLIFLGLHVAGIFKIPFLYRYAAMDFRGNARLGYFSSFLVGVTFSLGWTPCVGPILSGILLLASASQTVGHGALLLGAYSAGLGVPFLLAGLALDRAMATVRRFSRLLPAVSMAGGLFLVGMGLVIFTNLYARLPQFFSWWSWGYA